MPSMLIFLHEVTKLVVYAGCDLKQIEFLRIGTSGGIGAAPGTVVITERGVDAMLRDGYEHVELGTAKHWPANSDANLVEALYHERLDMTTPVMQGKTMGTDDFYEGQGRLDGALMPWYSVDDKIAFLQRAHKLGVRNIEMESNAFLYFFQRTGIPAAVLCVTLLDRLQGDQVTSTPAQLSEFS